MKNRRDSYILYLKELLEPLKDYFSVGVSFGDTESVHGEDISWFEMFARSSYGITAYTSAVGYNEYVKLFNDTVHEAIADKRYSSFADYDQKCVELIPLALMLFIHRKYTWDTYTDSQKNSLVAFLENINRAQLITNNWQFFRVIVCGILSKLTGRNYDSPVQDSWRVIDGAYTGNGWYRDGNYGPKDYYIAFGYHFYSLLHLYLFPDYTDRNRIIEERVQAFAKDYLGFFDNDGRMIPYGRSLIYRFATLSFWSMYLLTGHTEIDSTYIIGLIDKNLSWWKGQDIKTNGLLNLGYTYRNELLCENYNSSGSVYWTFKFFLILLIDNNSPIWDITPDYNENPGRNTLSVIANGDIVIERSAHWNIAYINSYDGVPNLQNTAKYMRFAYNSACGFNLSRNATDFYSLSDDSCLVFKIAGVKHLRERNLYYKNEGDFLEYHWDCGRLIKIKSYVIPSSGSYYRIHLIRSKIFCTAFETGFAIQSQNIRSTEINSGILIANNHYESSMTCLSENGTAKMVKNEVNSNIYHRHTVMPLIRYHILKGFNVIIDKTGFSSNAQDSESSDFMEIKQSLNGIRLYTDKGRKIISFGLLNAISLKINGIIGLLIEKGKRWQRI